MKTIYYYDRNCEAQTTALYKDKIINSNKVIEFYGVGATDLALKVQLFLNGFDMYKDNN